MTLYLTLAVIALASISYFSIRFAIKSRAEAKQARDELATQANEYKAREEDRRALSPKLDALHAGSLDASLDLLRDAAKTTGAADKLAGSPPPARDGN